MGDFMKLKRTKNDMNSYDYELINDGKILRILYGGNLDLYMSVSDGELLGDENKSIDFDITKENYEVYSLFDRLYKRVINGEVFEYDEEEMDDFFPLESEATDYTKTYAYQLLVKPDMSIEWISDEGPIDQEDKVNISIFDNDTYRLRFTRNSHPLDFGFKNSLGISVRFRNSGSRYDPFNCVFMGMYQEMQKIDPNYHQIHIAEVEYSKRKNKESRY